MVISLLSMTKVRVILICFLLQMAEEEEIRRLRKELVPKAQPMPYFDRPFIPRR